jgi:Uma2 family endonuclease
MSVVATVPPSTPGGPRPLKWTREEYYKLGELGLFQDKRVQLINGEIIEMGQQGWPHALTIGLVADLLRVIFAAGHWIGEQRPFRVTGSEPEPDVAVIPGSKRDYSDHPDVAALLVEVADATLFYDITTKAQLYAEAAVADYWVVDIANRQLHVFRDPGPIPDGGRAYRTHLTLGPTDTVSPLAAPTATIIVADLLP